MMGATVATQLAMRPLLRVLTLRRMVAAGSLVMAVATPAYLLSSAVLPVLAVSAVRGVGFALVVVGGAALVSELVADTHLSRGTGLFGLAAGLPNVVALPLGVLVAQRAGFLPVFVATSALALVAVPLTLAMGRTRGRSPHVPPPAPHVHPPLRPLARPAVVFLATAIGLGGTTTFLPLAVPQAAVASTALFVLSLCMIGGRVGAGALGDRLRPGRLVLPAVVVAGAGMAGIAVAAGPVVGAGLLVVVAAGLFGLGFGAVQNDSLVVILRRSGPGGHGTASTVWNLAYDGGTGAGAVLLGAVVAGADYSWAFGAAAVSILVSAPAAWRLGVAPARRPQEARPPRR
jgi:predicted MFS family arabinose efflux permease